MKSNPIKLMAKLRDVKVQLTTGNRVVKRQLVPKCIHIEKKMDRKMERDHPGH